jgi:hypothetical protein
MVTISVFDVMFGKCNVDKICTFVLLNEGIIMLINNNSIQLFMCRVNSYKANYRYSTL